MHNDATRHGFCHAVCWKSIFAGGITAAVVSLILFTLGSGIGIASFEPFGGDTETVASFSVKMAVWMIVMQWVSAGLGGYLAGRLRKKHVHIHNDEAFFRDTAHGFLTWAVATILVVVLATGTLSTVISGGAKAATAVTVSAAAGAGKAAVNAVNDPNAYYVDGLFRSATPSTSSLESNAEAGRIIVNGLKGEAFPEADKQYLAQMVAARTGLSQEEATARVNEVVAELTAKKMEAMDITEKTRKATATFAIFTALSMLIGAFIAAVAAAIGGGHREYYPSV